MQTPGIVLNESLALGLVKKMVTYAQLAEERGIRNVLVSEAGADCRRWRNILLA